MSPFQRLVLAALHILLRAHCTSTKEEIMSAVYKWEQEFEDQREELNKR